MTDNHRSTTRPSLAVAGYLLGVVALLASAAGFAMSMPMVVELLIHGEVVAGVTAMLLVMLLTVASVVALGVIASVLVFFSEDVE